MIGDANYYYYSTLLLLYIGTHITAYSPLGSPDAATMTKICGYTLLESPVVCEIARQVGKSPGQVLIRWGLQRGTSVIPKSTNPLRIQENINVFDFELSMEQMSRLSTSFPQSRIVAGSYWVKPNGPYKTIDELWS